MDRLIKHILLIFFRLAGGAFSFMVTSISFSSSSARKQNENGCSTYYLRNTTHATRLLLLLGRRLAHDFPLDCLCSDEIGQTMACVTSVRHQHSSTVKWFLFSSHLNNLNNLSAARHSFEYSIGQVNIDTTHRTWCDDFQWKKSTPDRAIFADPSMCARHTTHTHTTTGK